MKEPIICNNKNNLLLQLHITGKCNQHCKHCYHNEYGNEPITFNNIKDIIEQYKELLQKYNTSKGINERGIINITGGEPFVRKDFMDILELFNENRKYFSYGILTNGSFITDEIAEKLVKFEVNDVQVSVEGSKDTHDMIRGEGNFEKTFKAIDILNKHKIPTIVSFTASKMNYKEFPLVAEYCKEHNVTRLGSDRLVPIGNGENIKEQCLSPEECIEYFMIMKEEQDKALVDKDCNTEILMNRALHFIVTKKSIYGCSAGDSAIVIDEMGNILPCRRMPIKCGNVLEDNLSDVYFNNEIMNDLRKKDISLGCEKCRFNRTCNGGAKCISYAMYNDYKKADPFCPLIFYKRNNN